MSGRTGKAAASKTAKKRTIILEEEVYNMAGVELEHIGALASILEERCEGSDVETQTLATLIRDCVCKIQEAIGGDAAKLVISPR